MDKIRINMTIELDSDAELYRYLINVAPRRRATLLRALAMQNLIRDHQLRVGLLNTVTETKQEMPKQVIKADEEIITDEKQKSFSAALDDML